MTARGKHCSFSADAALICSALVVNLNPYIQFCELPKPRYGCQKGWLPCKGQGGNKNEYGGRCSLHGPNITACRE